VEEKEKKRLETAVALIGYTIAFTGLTALFIGLARLLKGS
jgi:hypothetical protein